MKYITEAKAFDSAIEAILQYAVESFKQTS